MDPFVACNSSISHYPPRNSPFAPVYVGTKLHSVQWAATRRATHTTRADAADLESVNWLQLAMNSHDSEPIRFIVRRNCFRRLTVVRHEIPAPIRNAILASRYSAGRFA